MLILPSEMKMMKDEKKLKKYNAELKSLLVEKERELAEEHQLKFGGYIDLTSLDAVHETKE